MWACGINVRPQGVRGPARARRGLLSRRRNGVRFSGAPGATPAAAPRHGWERRTTERDEIQNVAQAPRIRHVADQAHSGQQLRGTREGASPAMTVPRDPNGRQPLRTAQDPSLSFPGSRPASIPWPSDAHGIDAGLDPGNDSDGSCAVRKGCRPFGSRGDSHRGNPHPPSVPRSC